jgi:isopropylmalate/homocitrate/citramalate synthase
MTPYNPELTGHTPSKFCVGTHSGINGIRHILGDEADSVPIETLRTFLETLQNSARSEKKSFSESEVREMFQNYFEL